MPIVEFIQFFLKSNYMNLSAEFSKLVNNKTFLYFMLFIAGTNLLAFLISQKTNAILFFCLIAFLTHQFSKNMAIVLLVAVLSTNFLMANKGLREGLENADESKAIERISATDEDIAKAIPIVQQAKNNEELSAKMADAKANASAKAAEKKETIDINNADLNQTTTEEEEPEAFTGSGSGANGKKRKETFAPRLDYAATIEESYQHLDSILGSDSIQQLTTDTQKLMKQQQNLFNTMNQMVPVLEGAQNMLQKFDIEGLTSGLKGLQGFGSQLKK
jgi:hypothetical protein